MIEMENTRILPKPNQSSSFEPIFSPKSRRHVFAPFSFGPRRWTIKKAWLMSHVREASSNLLAIYRRTTCCDFALPDYVLSTEPLIFQDMQPLLTTHCICEPKSHMARKKKGKRKWAFSFAFYIPSLAFMIMYPCNTLFMTLFWVSTNC